ncbi:hypothetical protein PR370_07335 [Mycobacterium marinum]|uniref:AbiTii domain-containing protein n=1 Tax=Mycobacterium marinum TaxID=1781 RepID=UPI000EF071FF|nr:hypothetical protein [Mycobacterium marinum]MDC8980973.1 hypothetical protein [Mycobacterium marinum]MDC8999283.1 hypothetical protein [Mycobacterium marinum]MDC9009854.1 hypothetical protein [Mycobacterium marinum]RFZ49354.1 hypothetical protein MSS2_04251 [Mycobacterium marinum]
MSRLDDIIDAATGDTVPVPTLLRMVKVLAGRTQTAVLDDWVDKELDGYPDDAVLPDYRGPFDVMVLTNWTGPFGSGAKNFELGPRSVPKGLRDAGAFVVRFYEPVAALESLAQAKKPLHYPWSADVIGLLNGQIARGEIPAILEMHGLVSAHRIISPSTAKAAIDSVRTRVLALALDLEKILPLAGEPGQVAENPAAVNYMVTNHIYGDGNTVAIGDNASVSVPKGDLGALIAAVSSAGLSDGQVDELRAAIEADEAEGTLGETTSRVRAFLGKLTWEGAKTAGKVGIGAGGGVVAALVRSYFGF